MKNYAIILAAGLGSRMKVNEPKCMHEIIKKPMIQYINEAIDENLNLSKKKSKINCLK